MIGLMLAAALQATAPAPATPEDGTIVITATIDQLRAALDRCKAGGCTPRQDIVAAIRYAEAQFRGGKYLDARRILQDAIARDKARAQDDPAALSSLYEATVTVSLHDGEQDVARRAGGARMKLLRDHFGDEDARTLQAELDQADMLVTTNLVDEAEARYPVIARRAAAAHLPMVEAEAVMRQALMAHVARNETSATRLLTGLASDPAQSPVMRLAARALMARFARDYGNSRPADALVAAFVADGATDQPVLVWQPAIDDPTDPFATNPFFPVERNPVIRGEYDRAVWADIGFLIKPDGTVDTPDVLRGTPSQGWSKRIREAIARRRYLPIRAGTQPAYRIERWTWTADYCVSGDSLIRTRACRPHFVQLDLTPEPPKPS